ncbi:hypothetical protein AVEN_167199-1, partial [Araneus ventricosus]
IDEEFRIVKDVPIIVMGDFNVDVKRNEKTFSFLKKHLDLIMVPSIILVFWEIHIMIQLLQETLVPNY